MFIYGISTGNGIFYYSIFTGKWYGIFLFMVYLQVNGMVFFIYGIFTGKWYGIFTGK